MSKNQKDRKKQNTSANTTSANPMVANDKTDMSKPVRGLPKV